MKKGEIWLTQCPTDPNSKIRPVLIVSNNIKNSNDRIYDINVVKITSLQKSNGQKKAVNFAEDIVIKLRKDSILRCGSIYTIEKSLLHKNIHTLTLQEINSVNNCLKNTLDL